MTLLSINMQSFFLAVLLLCTTTGCGTVVPKPVVATQPSWDTTNQTSGFVAWTTNAAGLTTGVILSDRAKARCETLAKIYGKHWVPPFRPTFVVTNGGWWLNAEGAHKFGVMNRWRREGR